MDFDYEQYYKKMLKRCFRNASVQRSDINSSTLGLSLLYKGEYIFHLAYSRLVGIDVKIMVMKLSLYDNVHCNIIYEGFLPRLKNGEIDSVFLEKTIKNWNNNQTRYYRLQ